MRLLCTLGLFLALLHLSTSLLLAAFNIESFGPTKASNPAVMNHISTIVRRYDIIVIQEVRDTNLSAVQTLMTYVNNPAADYSYEVSQPLGPSTYKERYLFLYRHQMVTVTATAQYPFQGPNPFSRPPFVVRFSSPQTTVTDFVLIPQHTCPKPFSSSSKTLDEIDALFDVVTAVSNSWTNNIVLLGDFNAGCTYVRVADLQNIRLSPQRGFNWLIGDNVDTTVGHKGCPYDRIVTTNSMRPTVVRNSARVYDYEVAMGLTPQQAKAVSNHFPVEVQLN